MNVTAADMKIKKMSRVQLASCGSGVEPASCYRKVAGSLDCMSVGKTLNPKLLLMRWSAPCMAATAITVCMFHVIEIQLTWCILLRILETFVLCSLLELFEGMLLLVV